MNRVGNFRVRRQSGGEEVRLLLASFKIGPQAQLDAAALRGGGPQRSGGFAAQPRTIRPGDSRRGGPNRRGLTLARATNWDDVRAFP
jgi:hypothetical protein